MNKSKVFSVIFFLTILLSFSSLAQENDSAKYKHEFGFDASGIVRSIFSNFNPSPFNSFLYRYHGKDFTFRMRVAGNVSNNGGGISVNRGTNNFDSTNSKPSNNSNFDIRPGIQFNHSAKKILYYVGGDLILRIHNSSGGSDRFNATRSGSFFDSSVINNNSKTKNYSVGFSPIMGISFLLSERIRLTVESSAAISYETIKSETTTLTTRFRSFSSPNPQITSSKNSVDNSNSDMQFVPLNMFVLSFMF